MLKIINKAWYFIRCLILGSLTELSSHCVSLGGVISQAIFQMHGKRMAEARKRRVWKNLVKIWCLGNCYSFLWKGEKNETHYKGKSCQWNSEEIDLELEGLTRWIDREWQTVEKIANIFFFGSCWQRC